MVVTGARDSATAMTANGTPVKRPVRSSVSRRAISQSAMVSYRATWAVRGPGTEAFIVNMLSS